MHDRLGLFIDGQWSPGTSGRSGPVINPATGTEIAQVPFASTGDLDRVIDAAARAFETWKAILPQDRACLVRRIAALIRERADEIARIMVLEQGKPLAEAKAEVLATAELTEWLAEESRRIYGRIVPSRFANSRILVTHEPVGPVAAFAPWNFPCMMAGRKIAHALAAGCSVILKPAEETPGTAVALVKICEEAGVPPGVVNLVFGVPAEVSAHLIASPVIRKVSFTGSVAVGKHLARLAAENLTRVTLELGGHSPVIVFDDTDVDRALALSVAGKFRNAGQICTAPTRFIVQDNVYERFVDGFVAASRALTVGDGLDADTHMGPMANSRRVDAMEDLVAEATAQGATLRTGGERIGNQGYFFQPSVITDVPTTTKLMTTEPFGPVAIVMPFSKLEDAVAEANRLSFGLAAYVFARSQKRVADVTAELKSGVIAVNGMTVSAPEAPFGGVNDSGVGREAGSEGLLEYMNVKTVTETFA
jgi:succinate-semialdehyde dehydrogenase/glutarate-semialdehyde dehydrogenase